MSGSSVDQDVVRNAWLLGSLKHVKENNDVEHCPRFGAKYFPDNKCEEWDNCKRISCYRVISLLSEGCFELDNIFHLSYCVTLSSCLF